MLERDTKVLGKDVANRAASGTDGGSKTDGK